MTTRFVLLQAALCVFATLPSVAQLPINTSIVRADPAAAPAGGPLAPAFRRARDAVVHVMVEVAGSNRFKLERPSSGVVIAPSGLVVTLWDLVREAEGAADKKILVQTPDQAVGHLPAKIAARDTATGLALLQVELPAGKSLPATPLAAAPDLGDPCAVLSFHDGEDHVAFAGVVSGAQGNARAGDIEFARADILLTDAAIQARSHGAALLNAQGELLGICNAAGVAPEVGEPTLDDLKRPSYGFAIPSRTIRKVFAAACLASAAPPDQASKSAEAAVVALVQDSVVAVFASEADGAQRPALGNADPYATRRRKRVGSGVIVDTSGLVFTNRHLVHGAHAITVTLRDGTALPAEVLETHGRSNSALLRVSLKAGLQLKPVRCGSAMHVAVGETLLALGSPEGHPVSVRKGVLSAVRGSRVQTDAGTGNHNAGGALVTLRGDLVAVIDGGVVDPIDVAFAMRGEQAKVETSLDLSPSIDSLREAYRVMLDRHAGSNASLAAAPAHEPGNTGVADVVRRTAGSLLNIAIDFTTSVQELEDNPFAVSKGESMTEGMGSGAIIDPSGLALTNWHVVDDATQADGSMVEDRIVRAKLRDGRVFDADVLSISREEDLALLRLRLPAGQVVDAVELGASGVLAVGDQTIAIGNPHGRADTVTAGVITAKNQAIRVRGRWQKLPQLLETDAAINAGNSGGALLDGQGRLIGINSAGGSLHAVTGFSIAIDHVREKVRGLLLSPEKLRSAYAGCAVTDVGDKVVVQSVDRNGPAAAAGVQVNDVVRAVAEQPVRWRGEFALAWLRHDASAPVALELERDGKRLSVQVTPWSAPAWAVFRQMSLGVSELTMAESPDAVRAAAIACERHFTRDPHAEPREFPASVVRVDRVHPAVADKADVRAGDFIIGVMLRDEDSGADQLLRLQRVTDIQDCVNAHSTYEEGRTFKFWLFRGGEVRVVELTAKRLML
jgi:serine protease Do